ncbi:unnamed protein product [Didymodactylos carnosus]|uniref:VWFA domain-containing protein n=1 Tax=Didymodactylos carnosus TaxID=1234261 RepID=A0A814C5B6_9BILA|nr:unnamed protein product [Didymodactylos carnosus]CAF1063535.1 unnamed protein product [Didymodactylos carnosus]CAF3712660.1 unnamed protein product [Didymodactylos carnosus]CAF3828811.1 unnamed protein product [Didymodactylos carnosus]
MNGYKFEKTDEASLFMCEQITDDQTIIVGPFRYTWSQFKLQHPDWVFESLLNDQDLDRLHEKFLTIWTKIDRDLCGKYGMNFVTYNTQMINTPESYHYILLLDGSGSVDGQPWGHLIAAVKEFLQRRSELGTKDRITIIKFTHRTELECFDEEIKDVNVDRIEFKGGNTNFRSAFEKVNDCIARSKTADSKYAVKS